MSSSFHWLATAKETTYRLYLCEYTGNNMGAPLNTVTSPTVYSFIKVLSRVCRYFPRNEPVWKCF
jgi:hypothetical protein